MATIKDVAREAGVSTTTVSHVFSRKRQVATPTAEAVIAAARRLGYVPDAAARTLATGRSTIVGLQFEIGEDALLLNPFFGELLVGFAAASADFGFTFKLLSHDLVNPGQTASLVGTVVVDPTPDNPWIQYLSSRGARIVTIGRFLGGVETSWVDNSHHAAMLEVTRHLAEQDYRRPAMISVRHRMSYLSDIEAAFGQGCSEQGLRGELVYASDLSDSAARRTTLALLGRPDPPDAIVGAIDHMALGVIHAADELGVEVPRGLGVVGAGDTVLAQHAEPKLTTVKVEPAALASEAMRLIHEFWHAPELPDRRVTLPARLIVRESTSRRR